MDVPWVAPAYRVGTGAPRWLKKDHLGADRSESDRQEPTLRRMRRSGRREGRWVQVKTKVTRLALTLASLAATAAVLGAGVKWG